MGYEYGNARVASMRGRLLDRAAIARLGESMSVEAIVAGLERSEDWTPIIRGVASLGSDTARALDAAVDLHRSARSSALPRFYDEGERRLVEALVMPLDTQRALAVLRRRRSGELPDAIATSVIPGALLDARSLARMARASGPEMTLRPLIERRVLTREDAQALSAAETHGATTSRLETMLVAAIEAARRARAIGRGSDAAAVRDLLEREQAAVDAVVLELREGGPSLATILERSTRLERLDALAAVARRDPLGTGVVAGYVAAVEAQAIRIRAMVARVRAGWSAQDASPYLAKVETPAWLAS